MQCKQCNKRIGFLENYGTHTIVLCYNCAYEEDSNNVKTTTMFKPTKWITPGKRSLLTIIKDFTLTPKCLLNEMEKKWVEASLQTFILIFSKNVFCTRKTILPTTEFFPDTYHGDSNSIERVLNRICTYVNIGYQNMTIDIVSETGSIDSKKLNGFFPKNLTECTTTQGQTLFIENVGLTVDKAIADDAIKTIALLVRTLGQFFLSAQQITTFQQEDLPYLYDLLSIFFGFGIFSSNSIYIMKKRTSCSFGSMKGYRIGNLNERMQAYSLAACAYLKKEKFPSWFRFLNENVQLYFKQNYLYLFNTDKTELIPLS